MKKPTVAILIAFHPKAQIILIAKGRSSDSLLTFAAFPFRGTVAEICKSF